MQLLVGYQITESEQDRWEYILIILIEQFKKNIVEK